jgi:hypothetical protein
MYSICLELERRQTILGDEHPDTILYSQILKYYKYTAKDDETNNNGLINDKDIIVK